MCEHQRKVFEIKVNLFQCQIENEIIILLPFTNPIRELFNFMEIYLGRDKDKNQQYLQL